MIGLALYSVVVVVVGSVVVVVVWRDDTPARYAAAAYDVYAARQLQLAVVLSLRARLVTCLQRCSV